MAQRHPLDAQVVAFARPHHQPMPAEADRSMVAVDRAVLDVKTHGEGASVRGLERDAAAIELLAVAQA